MNNPEDRRQPQVKWYLRPIAVIIAILCIGPFALPLVWISPAFKKSHKIFVTILVIILTVWLAKASVKLYNLLLNEMQQLQNILNP